jgi:hypothetical protein
MLMLLTITKLSSHSARHKVGKQGRDKKQDKLFRLYKQDSGLSMENYEDYPVLQIVCL